MEDYIDYTDLEDDENTDSSLSKEEIKNVRKEIKENRDYQYEMIRYSRIPAMYLENVSTYFDKKGLHFIPKIDYLSINEAKDKSYVSRFKLKGVDLFRDLPINQPVKFDINKMKTAINNGMILMINYKGEEDDVLSGHERVIYPMVLGKSSKGKLLLRGFHLKGWSVSNNRQTEKIWRMFRPDRILSMTFTGSFFRLPPNGYNMYDKGMKGGILISADFNRLRKNQQKLIDSQKIQNKDDASITKLGLTKMKVVDTNTKLDITDPFKNKFLNVKELDFLTLTFMKSIFGQDYIAVLGIVSDKKNLTVKLFDDKKKPIGTYKTVSTFSGKDLKSFKVKKMKNESDYDLFIFTEKF